MTISKAIWHGYSLLAARPYEELDGFLHLDPMAQRRELALRLWRQLRYFASRGDALAEWRDAAAIRSPEELFQHWQSLPIMTKQMLNSRFAPEPMQSSFGVRGRINATGGSTGEPTRFLLDHAMLRASRAAHLYSRLQMGWRPGMPTIIVWGSEADVGRKAKCSQRLARQLLRDHVVPGFAVDDNTVRQVISLVRAKAPVAIYGYSSLLEFVARRVLELGEQLPAGAVRVAWNGGEMLYDHQIALFRRAFGVPILNRYGGREMSVTAFQAAEGEPLRILRPWIFLEIVDEAGKPAAPGEPGRLLLTSTICRGTPFLRYDIGDLGTYAAGDCDESGIRRIRELHGRHSGAARLANGKLVSGIYWNHLIKDFPEVKQFQVRVGNRGELSIRLVGNRFTDSRSEQFRAALRPLTEGQPVELIWIEQIPKTPQGKLLQVVMQP